MISRHEFPYLQSLVINDAYAVKNMTVPVFRAGEEFKHLILTGRNGSGKTTVLQALIRIMRYDIANGRIAKVKVDELKSAMASDRYPELKSTWQSEIDELNRVEPHFTSGNSADYKLSLIHI